MTDSPRRSSLRLSRALASTFVVSAVAMVGCSDAGSPDRFGQTSAADSTFPNDKAAYDFFIGKGLTGEQAAGIVGNLDVESGDDPRSVQSGGPGRGLAQWLEGGRWDTTTGDNATDYAAQQGEELLSLDLQLEFVWYELTKFPDYGLADIKSATSVSGAVEAFEAHFEGCSTCDSSARIADGEAVLAAYGNDVATDGGASGDDDDAGNGSNICTISTGEVGSCLDTGVCATLGNHMSTAGFCPGAANIECCTVVDAGTGTSSGGATTDGGSAGSGSPSSSKDGGSASADSSDSSGGCSVSPGGGSQHSSGAGDVAGLAGLALALVRRRKRSS